MTIQLSVAARNARLDAIETAVGTAALLKVYTGLAPADCATAASGTLLATLTLPSDWLAAASGGAKAKSGTWSGTASNTGTAGYARVYDNAGTTCHLQGTCGIGTGDFQFDNTSLANGQPVSCTGFTLTDGNA